MATNKDNPHKNHRKRLRSRYVENGISSLHEHEILEMLLFYSIPVVNTNPLAHELLNKFGSLKNVLEASPEELSQISGLGDNSVIFLGFLKDVCSIISKEPEDKKTAMTFESIGELFVEEFKNDKKERVVILLLDAANKIISRELVCEGAFDGAALDIRKIAWLTMTKCAAKVAIAHNHPDGSLLPSLKDKSATTMLTIFLNQLGVELTEHYIVANKDYVGIKNLIS